MFNIARPVRKYEMFSPGKLKSLLQQSMYFKTKKWFRCDKISSKSVKLAAKSTDEEMMNNVSYENNVTKIVDF